MPSVDRPLRVLFVQGSGVMAGAERMMLALLRNLDPAEVAPTVAVLGEGPFLDTLRETPNVEVVQLPDVGRLRDLPRLPATVQRLRQVIEERRVDVVEAAGEKMSVYAGWAAKLAGVPMVAWLHDSPAMPGDRSARVVQEAMARSPKTAAITCSRWMADEFRARHGIPARGIDYGLELDRFPAPGAGRADVLGLAGWPDDAVVFGFFGRLQHWKGPDTFLDAAATVVQRRPDTTARFLLVGGALYGRDEEFAASLPGRAQRLGIADRVHFAGYRTDALTLMSGVDVVVHCSRLAEPFGLVVIEGAYLERAVVATRSRGPDEAIVSGEHGLLVPPDDPTALADAMERLLDDDLRNRLGRAGRERVAERFDARRMAADFTALWRDLVGPAA